MTDEGSFKIGDIIEVKYSRNAIGYLYKELEDRILLTNVTDPDPESPVRVILKKDLIAIASFGENEPREPEVKKVEEKEPGTFGKLIEFPGKPNTGEDAV